MRPPQLPPLVPATLDLGPHWLQAGGLCKERRESGSRPVGPRPWPAKWESMSSTLCFWPRKILGFQDRHLLHSLESFPLIPRIPPVTGRSLSRPHGPHSLVRAWLGALPLSPALTPALWGRTWAHLTSPLGLSNAIPDAQLKLGFNWTNSFVG